MKTLSIRQPWASLIAHGIKDIENRTWPTKYRGRIYIHASGQPSFSNLTHGLSHDQMDAFVLSNSGLYLDAKHDSYPKMAIIGEVDIVDCVKNYNSIWAELQWQHMHVCWNWVLANPVLYDEPILNVKGRLSLWEYKGLEANNES